MALQLFAASLLEVCPKAILLRTEVTKVSFVCDFILPFELSKDYIHMIEERMRSKVSSEVVIELLEMVSSNAREYLLHQKQRERADAIDLSEQFTNIVRIDDYANYIEGPIETEKKRLGAFELRYSSTVGVYEDREVSTAIQRVEGWAFSEKKELKEFRKLLKEFYRVDHRKKGLYEGENIFPECMKYITSLQNSIIACFSEFVQVRTGDDSFKCFLDGVHKNFYELRDEPIREGTCGLKEGGGPHIVFSSYDKTEYVERFCQLLEKIRPPIIIENNKVYLEDPLRARWEIATLIKSKKERRFIVYLCPLYAVLLESLGEMPLSHL